MTKITPRTKQLKGIGVLALAFVIPIIIIFVAKMFFFSVYVIPSGSMENTLNVGDKVVTLTLAPTDGYNHGDIIVFSDDLGWTSLSNAFLIKRIIGLPGDKVSSDGVKVYVNGEPLEEKYTTGTTSAFPEQLVPAGKIFVMGDNREHSADSRAHINTGTQFVSINSITGRFWFKIF